jgi:hypothetical protein
LLTAKPKLKEELKSNSTENGGLCVTTTLVTLKQTLYAAISALKGVFHERMDISGLFQNQSGLTMLLATEVKQAFSIVNTTKLVSTIAQIMKTLVFRVLAQPRPPLRSYYPLVKLILALTVTTRVNAFNRLSTLPVRGMLDKLQLEPCIEWMKYISPISQRTPATC